MPSVNIDQSQVAIVGVSTKDTDGTEIQTQAFVVPVVIPLSEVGSWLATYDPASSTSPSAADSRVIARAVLAALKQKAEE